MHGSATFPVHGARGRRLVRGARNVLLAIVRKLVDIHHYIQVAFSDRNTVAPAGFCTFVPMRGGVPLTSMQDTIWQEEPIGSRGEKRPLS